MLCRCQFILLSFKRRPEIKHILSWSHSSQIFLWWFKIFNNLHMLTILFRTNSKVSEKINVSFMIFYFVIPWPESLWPVDTWECDLERLLIFMRFELDLSRKMRFLTRMIGVFLIWCYFLIFKPYDIERNKKRSLKYPY